MSSRGYAPILFQSLRTRHYSFAAEFGEESNGGKSDGRPHHRERKFDGNLLARALTGALISRKAFQKAQIPIPKSQVKSNGQIPNRRASVLLTALVHLEFGIWSLGIWNVLSVFTMARVSRPPAIHDFLAF